MRGRIAIVLNTKMRVVRQKVKSSLLPMLKINQNPTCLLGVHNPDLALPCFYEAGD